VHRPDASRATNFFFRDTELASLHFPHILFPGSGFCFPQEPQSPAATLAAYFFFRANIRRFLYFST
jgi:hypothetical protein